MARPKRHSIITHVSNRSRLLVVAGLALTAMSACDRPHVESAAIVDTRTTISLSVASAEHLRRGMRAYLESTQAIVEALAESNHKSIAEHARKSGTGATQDIPLWTAVSLPPEFVLLGLDTHQKFDALAAAARQNASRKEILEQLGNILLNCMACHSGYRLSAK
jgi:cytochrome c556